MAFTAFRTWVAGEVPTDALLNAQIRDNGLILKTSIADDGTLSALLASRTTSDFIKNANTTLGDVTGLSFAIGASEVWAFLAAAYYISNASADLKYNLTVPSGASGRYGVSQGTQVTIGTTIVLGTDGTDDSHVFVGTVVNSTTAGTVQLQAAQNSSHASNTTIYTNSSMLAVKIG